MPSSLLFDSPDVIARVSDFFVPLLSQSLLPLQGENQLVTALARKSAHRQRRRHEML
jgi:hypothetical protein